VGYIELEASWNILERIGIYCIESIMKYIGMYWNDIGFLLQCSWNASEMLLNYIGVSLKVLDCYWNAIELLSECNGLSWNVWICFWFAIGMLLKCY